MVHCLFCRTVAPRLDMGKLAALREMLAESLANRDRDPDSVYGRRVKRLLTSGHPFFRDLELPDLQVTAAHHLNFWHRSPCA